MSFVLEKGMRNFMMGMEVHLPQAGYTMLLDYIDHYRGARSIETIAADVGEDVQEFEYVMEGLSEMSANLALRLSISLGWDAKNWCDFSDTVRLRRLAGEMAEELSRIIPFSPNPFASNFARFAHIPLMHDRLRAFLTHLSVYPTHLARAFGVGELRAYEMKCGDFPVELADILRFERYLGWTGKVITLGMRKQQRHAAIEREEERYRSAIGRLPYLSGNHHALLVKTHHARAGRVALAR